MRRILLVGDYPPPYGGLSVQVASLTHHLAARPDTTVQVIDIGARRHELRAGCLPARGPLGLAGRILLHTRRGFTPHLHTNGHNRKSWLVTLGCTTLASLGRRRAVVSLGSGLMPAFLERAGVVMRAVARAGLAAAGAVIVRNERARAALIELGVAAEKVSVLPGFYGVAEDEIGAPPPEAVAFRQCHAPLIGAIASVGPEYGLALLLDAAARLRPTYPRLGLLLLGPDGLDAGCPEWALPVGECDRPTLLAAMRELDALVRPTYFDGDASSVREALALGVRVVASDTDFRPEGVWRFPCGDADALADTIDRALRGVATRAESTSLPALLAIYDGLAADGVRTAPHAAAPTPDRTVRVG